MASRVLTLILRATRSLWMSLSTSATTSLRSRGSICASDLHEQRAQMADDVARARGIGCDVRQNVARIRNVAVLGRPRIVWRPRYC